MPDTLKNFGTTAWSGFTWGCGFKIAWDIIGLLIDWLAGAT